MALGEKRSSCQGLFIQLDADGGYMFNLKGYKCTFAVSLK